MIWVWWPDIQAWVLAEKDATGRTVVHGYVVREIMLRAEDNNASRWVPYAGAKRVVTNGFPLVYVARNRLETHLGIGMVNNYRDTGTEAPHVSHY